mgnify:FL=1
MDLATERGRDGAVAAFGLGCGRLEGFDQGRNHASVDQDIIRGNAGLPTVEPFAPINFGSGRCQRSGFVHIDRGFASQFEGAGDELFGSRQRNRAGAFLAGLSYLALALFIIALARPQLGRVTTRVQATGVDIMFVIDVSRSMLAEDFTIVSSRSNRIDTVKLVTEQFIRQRPNDRIGIVAFAGRPFLVCPLTLVHERLIQNLERLRIGLVEDGTAIGSAIAAAANRLKDKEAKTKLIVLLTDGDNNAGKVQPLTAAEAAKALGIRIYTIGAGT